MSSYIDPRFPGADPYAPLKKLPIFELTSTTFANGAEIPVPQAAPHNVSPALSWSQLPAGTKSIAITCFDPDAPTAAGFWHWAVFNIPVDITEVAEGAGSQENLGINNAIALRGDSGQRTYYGPQPPQGHGPHRYLFAVHAVDVEKLDISPDATPAVLGFNLYFHSLGRAIHWGWYENPTE
ncbi:YbhB/YbcL family Raf kinase inhibitor-like protein [Corynebacterium kutscheri]|uniref:YbhB/YbcL family Raf kinase inhibitor-like protein n=1 Tax=Corynebacterium kutscheri TaxID=35755 RepID=UPI0037C02D72